jgi:hypothetical protein
MLPFDFLQDHVRGNIFYFLKFALSNLVRYSL